LGCDLRVPRAEPPLGRRLHRDGIIDIGAQGPGGFDFAQWLTIAGTYPYHSTVPGDPTNGTIGLPMVVPAKGIQNTPFTVTWATPPRVTPPPTGATVQVKTPGGSLTTWLSSTTALSGAYPPTAGPGVYQFRSRMIRNGHTSNWSPMTSVTVH
jgi:hypothetical protein